MPLRRWLRTLLGCLTGLALAVALLGPARSATAVGSPRQPLRQSSDSLAWQAPFNRPAFYPLDRRPANPAYRPHAAWIGRLILPEAPAAGLDHDWVWLEVQQAPAEQAPLIGRRLRLEWSAAPALQEHVRRLTTDIRFGAAARLAREQGNVVPDRLNGRRRVGPLQSLAGARPHDDLLVRLEPVAVRPDALVIDRPPLQISGRWSALVQIEAALPGDSFRVRHYNRATGRFDGASDRIRIPQQPRDRYGRWLSSPRGLLGAPAGVDGWYVHGAPDRDGVFTVQALEPRALMRLPAERQVRGLQPSLVYMSQANWADTPRRRGRIERVQLGTAAGSWRLGDRALVMHSFGGIGGSLAEPTPLATVTGHFAFGEAWVVDDPFTGEPRFEIHYHQIYANNPNGIVAGRQDWSAFSGDLQRGWLGSRPIADALIRLDLEPDAADRFLRELGLQAEVLMARYRSGDGGGVALITPATSCVQDSAQALELAIASLRDPGPRLAALGHGLRHLLRPFGVERPDWRHNGALVAQSQSADHFRRGGLLDAILSWRTMIPRRGYDDLAALLLNDGASLRLLRSNQLPGGDLTIAPLAPTLLLGQLPILSTVLRRSADALFTPLSRPMLFSAGGLAVLYAVVALAMGWSSRWLPRRWPLPPPALLARAPRRLLGLLLLPALAEEWLFRVLLLPNRSEGFQQPQLLGWFALALGLFVLYHPLAAISWYPAGRPLFLRGPFLLQCSWLGLLCGLLYLQSGSLWPPLLLHWGAVVCWLEQLDGRRQLADLCGSPGHRSASRPS